MISPENDPLLPAAGGPASPARTDGEEPRKEARALGLSAFDTLRAIVRAPSSAPLRSLFVEARHRVFRGESSGIMWIVAAQQLEHEGEVPRSIAAFLVAAFAEDIAGATWDGDPEMMEISRRIEAIERGHGLRPDQYWRLGEGPPEWQAAEREWEDAFVRRWQALLRRFGEHEMADLLETDRDEFERRLNEAELALFG